jgi:hypothetical protein
MEGRQGSALPQRSRLKSSAKPVPAVTESAREVPLQVLVPSHIRKQVELLTVETGESLSLRRAARFAWDRCQDDGRRDARPASKTTLTTRVIILRNA